MNFNAFFTISLYNSTSSTKSLDYNLYLISGFLLKVPVPLINNNNNNKFINKYYDVPEQGTSQTSQSKFLFFKLVSLE
jgi:hypothetical protein